MLNKYYINNKLLNFISIAFCLGSLNATACQFCEEEPIIHPAQQYTAPAETWTPPREFIQNRPVASARFSYVKLGGGVPSSISYYEDVCPAIGLGKRYEWGNAGVDISMNFTGDDSECCTTIPKIMYLRYFDSNSRDSLYFGTGLSWGMVRSFNHSRFQGILGELAFGYEFQRCSPIHTFVECTLSQGIINTYKKGHLPSPVLTLTAGIGY